MEYAWAGRGAVPKDPYRRKLARLCRLCKATHTLFNPRLPTADDVKGLTAELHDRAKLPAHVESMIRNFPKGMHPMTQFSSAVLAMQVSFCCSHFSRFLSSLLSYAYTTMPADRQRLCQEVC